MSDPPWIDKLPTWYFIYLLRMEKVFRRYTPHKVTIEKFKERMR